LTAIQNTVHFAKKQHMKMVQVIDQWVTFWMLLKYNQI
jgi:hypothetical protein